MTENGLMIVEKAFEEWMKGTSYVSRLFAPEMTWEIVGRSAVSARYRNAEEFLAEVLEPFGRRFKSRRRSGRSKSERRMPMDRR